MAAPPGRAAAARRRGLRAATTPWPAWPWEWAAWWRRSSAPSSWRRSRRAGAATARRRRGRGRSGRRRPRRWPTSWRGGRGADRAPARRTVAPRAGRGRRPWRPRVARRVSSVGGVTAVVAGGVAITTTWATRTTPERLWRRRILPDVGNGPLAVAAADRGVGLPLLLGPPLHAQQPVHVGDPRRAPLERALQPVDGAAPARRRGVRDLRALRLAVPVRHPARTGRDGAGREPALPVLDPHRDRRDGWAGPRRSSTRLRTTACTTGRTASTSTATTAAS